MKKMKVKMKITTIEVDGDLKKITFEFYVVLVLCRIIMLFKIQIIKLIKRVFWLIPIITCVDFYANLGRVLNAKSKRFLIFRHASPLKCGIVSNNAE